MSAPNLLAIVEAWEGRAKGMNYKPGSVRRAKAALEFFSGVHSALAAQGGPGIAGWLLLLSVGREPRELLPRN